MKNFLSIVVLFLITLSLSCSGDIAEPPDLSIQATEDSVAIVNYIHDLGLSDLDSVLASGVHFIVLDSGQKVDDGAVDTLSIDESDIVDVDYIGKLLTDTIFDTSIRGVADSIRLAVEANITPGDTLDVEYAVDTAFHEDKNYAPFEVVYTSTGWTINGFIEGFSEGLTASLGQLSVGGSALIVIPSALAYGVTGNVPTIFKIGVDESGEDEFALYQFIEPNKVIAFEIRIASLRKQ